MSCFNFASLSASSCSFFLISTNAFSSKSFFCEPSLCFFANPATLASSHAFLFIFSSSSSALESGLLIRRAYGNSVMLAARQAESSEFILSPGQWPTVESASMTRGLSEKLSRSLEEKLASNVQVPLPSCDLERAWPAPPLTCDTSLPNSCTKETSFWTSRRTHV